MPAAEGCASGEEVGGGRREAGAALEPGAPGGEGVVEHRGGAGEEDAPRCGREARLLRPAGVAELAQPRRAGGEGEVAAVARLSCGDVPRAPASPVGGEGRWQVTRRAAGRALGPASRRRGYPHRAVCSSAAVHQTSQTSTLARWASAAWHLADRSATWRAYHAATEGHARRRATARPSSAACCVSCNWCDLRRQRSISRRAVGRSKRRAAGAGRGGGGEAAVAGAEAEVLAAAGGAGSGRGGLMYVAHSGR